MRKHPLLFMLLVPCATCALADLELSVETDYPRHLELKIPVKEDTDFKMHTSFDDGEFFSATGHVGRISGLSTNRMIKLTYGFDYKLGGSQGSSTGSQSQSIAPDHYPFAIVSSLLAANPMFDIREVPTPVPLGTGVTNWTIITNVLFTPKSNSPTSSNTKPMPNTALEPTPTAP